jgi:hypothetical protein
VGERSVGDRMRRRLSNMTEALAGKTCTPCRGGISPLTREQTELFHAQAPRLATGGGRSPRRAGASGFAISARRLPSKYLRINSRLRSLRRILNQSPLRLLGITGDRECCAPACSREASCPNLNACRPSFHSLQLSAPPVRSARPR